MTQVPYFPVENKDLISPKEERNNKNKNGANFPEKKSETQKQEVTSKD